MLYKAEIFYVSLLAISIYYLNAKFPEQQYEEDVTHGFPELFELDDYDECLLDPNGLFCLVDIELTSDEASDLWYRIKSVSSYNKVFFRHDILHRGVCVTKRCNMSGVSPTTLHADSRVRRAVLAEWANRDMKEQFGFNANVTIKRCSDRNENKEISTGAIVYTAIIAGIILLGIVSSFVTKPGDEIKGMFYGILCAFNTRQNFNYLTTKFEKEHWVLGLHRIRPFISILIVFSHFYILTYNVYFKNPEVLEAVHQTRLVKFLVNITLYLQIFFVMSGLQLTVNFLEKTNITPNFRALDLVLERLGRRWLRLTPAYAAIVGFTVFWVPHMTKGLVVPVSRKEVQLCQESWWANLLYINSFVGSIICVPQAWYLTIDMQFYFAGLVILIIAHRLPKLAKLLIGGLLLGTIITPGLLTYINEYNPLLIVTPEGLRNTFANDPAFEQFYLTFKGNASSMMIGIVAGYVHFYIKKNNLAIAIGTHKRMLLAMHATSMLLVSFALFALYIFLKSPFVNPIIGALFASLGKPIPGTAFAFLMVAILNNWNLGIFTFFKNKIFDVPTKLNYSVYLVHLLVIDTVISYLDLPLKLDSTTLIWLPILCLPLVYMVAFFWCLFIETPFVVLSSYKVPAKSKNLTKEALNKTN